MARKKRKRKPLKANPKRQAHASLRGYLYQIWHSVNAWVHLADDDLLYLEGAEDFDIISDDTATTTQVKDTQRNITLRSKEVIDAINHYWKLQDSHPKLTVKFRFLTRSKIGVEQGNPFGKSKAGLQVWSRCSGDEAAIEKISEFLQNQEKISDKVKKFLKQTSPQQIYEQLIKPITWETGSKPVSFVERSINEKLVLHGDQLGFLPAESKKVADRLLKEALMVATQKKNRELTKVRFLEIFEEDTTRRIPEHQWLQYQQMLAAKTGFIGSGFTSAPSDVPIQSQGAIQNIISLPYYEFAPRTDLLTKIQNKLQSDGIVVIQGGVDTGKTTLAKLTANALNGSWFWLNLRKNDQSQVTQLLHQLAIVVGNEPSQVNVVLDDLNLQESELQEYEDVLGMVIYRVLERGAKLLITSQYEPSDNLIRSLGLSSSVVVDTRHFTPSEIEQFAEQLGCPAEHAKTWSEWVQIHTNGHPRLVHARLTQLQQEDWKYQGKIESLLQTPQEVERARKEARQLLVGLSEDQREFLYRLSMLTEFREDYARNIGEIPESIPYPGDIFSQLVGPWIDQVSENYYTISPLLKNAANEVWSESKISDLHAEVANAILKANNLTIIEAGSVLLHSIRGVNKKGVIAVIASLMTASNDDWRMVSQTLSWVTHIKTNPSKELFPGDIFANYCFRSLQYRIAVEVEPEFAPKILEIWDKETTPHEPRQSYLLCRLMLGTRALMHHQVVLPAKKLVNYLKEMIDITKNNKEVQEAHMNSMEPLGKDKTDKSNYFSILFSFIYARNPFYAPILSDLIDALDELQPEIRDLLLADFKNDSIDCQILINGVWLSEARLEKPDWNRCLEVFDKIIEKTIEWSYPYIAAASARGKAIVHDEKLNDLDTAHKVLQDIISKVGPLPAVEEEQAFVYLHQKNYKEALNIYERLLPEWNPPSEQLGIGPLEEYRRAAICAASFGDWKKAATFLEEGAKRTQKVEQSERYIGLYADAGFAQFKAGNMLDSIKLLNLALQNFERLPQDNTNLKYFTLKKRLMGSIGWIAYHEDENYTSESEEPPIGFCSNPETNEEVLNLPDYPIGYAWSALAKIEYKFGHGTIVLEHVLQIPDRDTDPVLNGTLSLLEIQYDFRNKTFNNLPQRIYQVVNAYVSKQKHYQSGKGIAEKGIYSIPISDSSRFASVENITVLLIKALLVQLPTEMEAHESLTVWRANSSYLPIKENLNTALDLIESMLLGNQNNALTVMGTQKAKSEERLAAALKVIQSKETGPENLFFAHTFISTLLVGTPLGDFFEVDLAGLFSSQWLEKIKFQATLKTPMITAPEIEKACKSNETGKKKIGQILLAAYQAVSIRIAPETLQQLHSWAESAPK